MRAKKPFLPLVVITFFIIGGVTFYFFGKDIQQKLFPPKDTNVPGGAISRTEPIVTCAAGDKACADKNEKIIVNRIEGPIATFARHQCDGPRACPTPNEEENKSFTDAIKKYTKESSLELVKVNGINPAGVIYYCAKDGRCWSYDTKSKKVALIENQEKANTSSPSGKTNR